MWAHFGGGFNCVISFTSGIFVFSNFNFLKNLLTLKCMYRHVNLYLFEYTILQQEPT